MLPQAKGPPSTIFAWPPWRCICLSLSLTGGIPSLLPRQKTRVHKVRVSDSYKKCWIQAVVQTGPENNAAGQSQIGHPCQQYSCFEKIRYWIPQYYTVQQKEQWIGYSMWKMYILLLVIWAPDIIRSTMERKKVTNKHSKDILSMKKLITDHTSKEMNKTTPKTTTMHKNTGHKLMLS